MGNFHKGDQRPTCRISNPDGIGGSDQIKGALERQMKLNGGGGENKKLK